MYVLLACIPALELWLWLLRSIMVTARPARRWRVTNVAVSVSVDTTLPVFGNPLAAVMACPGLWAMAVVVLGAVVVVIDLRIFDVADALSLGCLWCLLLLVLLLLLLIELLVSLDSNYKQNDKNVYNLRFDTSDTDNILLAGQVSAAEPAVALAAVAAAAVELALVPEVERLGSGDASAALWPGTST